MTLALQLILGVVPAVAVWLIVASWRRGKKLLDILAHTKRKPEGHPT